MRVRSTRWPSGHPGKIFPRNEWLISNVEFLRRVPAAMQFSYESGSLRVQHDLLEPPLPLSTMTRISDLPSYTRSSHMNQEEIVDRLASLQILASVPRSELMWAVE